MTIAALKWHKLNEKKPENADIEQVILKLGNDYVFLSGSQVNKNIIEEANWSEEQIKQQASMNSLMGFFGQVSGFEVGKLDVGKSDQEIRGSIEKKKLAVEKAEWCYFSEFVRFLLQK